MPRMATKLAVFFVGLCAVHVCGQDSQSATKLQPQSAATPEIITSLTLERFQATLQAMGFECIREKDAQGKLESYFIFRAEGYKVVAEVPSPEYGYLANVFTEKLKPEFVNQWNQTNNFSRTFVDKEKNLVIDTEIIVDGGVTTEHIESSIKTFRSSVARWARFIQDHKEVATPSSPPTQDHQGQ